MRKKAPEKKSSFGADLNGLIVFPEPLKRASQGVQQSRIVWRVGEGQLVIGAFEIVAPHCRIACGDSCHRLGIGRLFS